MARVLLTGASGFLGRALARRLSGAFELTGAFLTGAPPQDCRSVSLDVRDEAAVRRRVEELKPDLVIHAAAVANPDLCEARPQEAKRVNVEGSAAVARCAAAVGARLFYISTDLVFDGRAAPYREEDPTSPLSLYARTKREGELKSLELCPDALVLRLALSYGWKPYGQGTFTDFLYNNLSKGAQVRLYSDQVRAALYVADAAELVARLAGTRREGSLRRGIFHLAGPEGVSRLRFGEVFCDVFGFDRALLVPVRMAEEPLAASRPADCTMDGSKLHSLLSYSPRPVPEALRSLRDVNHPGLKV